MKKKENETILNFTQSRWPLELNKSFLCPEIPSPYVMMKLVAAAAKPEYVIIYNYTF